MLRPGQACLLRGLTRQVLGRLVAAPPRVHHFGIADQAGVGRAQARRRRAEAAHEGKVKAGALDEAGGDAVVAAGALEAGAAAAAVGTLAAVSRPNAGTTDFRSRFTD